jgi:glycosyltransferase involved in cell wall biosynthesis
MARISVQAATAPSRMSAGPRRILLIEINEDGTAGGSHQALFDLITLLDRRAFEPSVVFYEDNRFAERLRNDGVAVHIWKTQRDHEKSRRFQSGVAGRLNTGWSALGAIRSRLALLHRERIELIHLNNSPCIGFEDWLPAARLKRVPISCHSRGPFFAPGSGVGRWLTRRFDAYIAISRFIAEDLARSGVPAGRIHLINDGIDLGNWPAPSAGDMRRTRAEHGVPDDALLLILVGLVRSWKGQAVAIEALRQLTAEERRAVRLWIVGGVSSSEAAYADSLRRQIDAGGLDETVTMLGHRSDVPRLMGAADVVLHTSTVPEPFGLVVVEGLALGKMVVASQRGGPAEILRAGDGLLFDPERPEDLTAILRDLIKDPAGRLRFAERARTRAGMFDVHHTVDALARVWTGLLTA